MTNYRNSNKRLTFLLACFAVIVYSIFQGDETTKVLSLGILGIWILGVRTWLEEKND